MTAETQKATSAQTSREKRGQGPFSSTAMSSKIIGNRRNPPIPWSHMLIYFFSHVTERKITPDVNGWQSQFDNGFIEVMWHCLTMLHGVQRDTIVKTMSPLFQSSRRRDITACCLHVAPQVSQYAMLSINTQDLTASDLLQQQLLPDLSHKLSLMEEK